MAEITVSLMMRKGRTHWECQWLDPISGKKKTKTTKTDIRRDAERFAGKLAHQLSRGEKVDVSNTPWKEVAESYITDGLGGLAETTIGKFKGTNNKLVELIDPGKAAVLTTPVITSFTTAMREQGIQEATIKAHLTHLRACLRWAKRQGYIHELPVFTMPKRVGKMKGRPPTAEEFDRILDAIPKVVKAEEFVAEWLWTARGLWWSGLRLSEALMLTWDPSDFCVDMTGEYPRLRIEVNTDKSTESRLLPLAPEFVEMLLSVPEAKRTGYVFNPVVPGQITDRIRMDSCSKMFVEVGKVANVMVAKYPSTLKSRATTKAGKARAAKKPKTTERIKWASAHDFRRAFGTRWAKKLRPFELKELMRHKSIKTAEGFYVELDAEEIEKAMRPQEKPPANTPANIPEPTPPESDVSP